MKFLSKSYIKRALRLPLKIAAAPLSIVIKRSAHRWAFGNAGAFFAGNSKYLFLWMSANCTGFHVVWLSNNRQTVRHLKDNGYTARLRWSPFGIWAALRAGVFVSCNSFYDVNYILSSNTFRLNLWHGVGLKSLDDHPQAAVGPARETPRSTASVDRVKAWFRNPRPDLFITTSDMTQAHFARAFGLPFERCPKLGYPRLDCALDDKLASTARELDKNKGFEFNPHRFAEIYLYAPTHRDSVRPFFSDAIPDGRRLSEILGERNALLYIKPHPGTSDSIPSAPNIRRWPNDIDIHPYLATVTALITDYSSVLYDYLVLSSGVPILYTFDFGQYNSQDRVLQYDYEENTVGLRVTTFDMLCNALQCGVASKLPPNPEVDAIVQRFWGPSHTPACPAIVDHVMAYQKVK